MSVNFAVVDNAMTTMDKIKSYILAGMDTAIDVVSDFTDYEIQEFDDKTESSLKKIMTEYIEMELDMKQFIEAVHHVKDHVKARDNDCRDVDLPSMIDEKVAELEERDQGINLKDHLKFKALEEKMKIAKDTESSLETSLEGDVQVSQAIVSTKCPFSGKEMKEPMKNVICGHTYDIEGVRQLMKQRAGRAKCPVVGCANSKHITEKDLVDDREMKRAILMRNRQLKSAKH